MSGAGGSALRSWRTLSSSAPQHLILTLSWLAYGACSCGDLVVVPGEFARYKLDDAHNIIAQDAFIGARSLNECGQTEDTSCGILHGTIQNGRNPADLWRPTKGLVQTASGMGAIRITNHNHAEGLATFIGRNRWNQVAPDAATRPIQAQISSLISELHQLQFCLPYPCNPGHLQTLTSWTLATLDIAEI